MIHPMKKAGGFTLIELLTVIAIIGILAAIVFPLVSGAKVSAAKSKDASQIRQIGMSVLLYNSEKGVLPGRVNRAVKIPSSVSDTDREKWLSTFMIDAGYLEDAESLWEPTMDYGISEAGHNYILNNTIYSSPSNFFGRRSNTPEDVTEPLRMTQLKSNIAAEAPEYQQLAQIWMMSNIDGVNYGSVSSANSAYAVTDEVLTPWGGRNYVFFDGRVSFLTPDDYPSRD